MMRHLATLSCFFLIISSGVGGFTVTAPNVPPPFRSTQQPQTVVDRRVASLTSHHSFPLDSSLAQNPRCLALQAHRRNDDTDETSRPRRLSWRQRWRRWTLSLALASSFLRPAPANAKFSYELRETPTSSLRPGTTRQQAEMVEEGKLDGRSIEAKTAVSESTSTATPSTKAKASTKASLYGDDDYDEDDFDNFLEQEVVSTASQADQMAAQRLQSKSNFAAYHQGKSKALTFKVGVAFFVPTYGALIVREYVRRRREEAYVQKGLEILEAQKAEYFNVTETAADSDVQDALKNLKKNETDSDEDDDEDDEDDDDDSDDNDKEDKPPRGRKGGPRRPPGGGGDDGDSSGGAGDGSGRPSDEDLDKLNQMFKRS